LLFKHKQLIKSLNFKKEIAFIVNKIQGREGYLSFDILREIISKIKLLFEFIILVLKALSTCEIVILFFFSFRFINLNHF